jgi:hypothetical protein
LTKPFKEILLYEIQANTRAYTLNKVITERGNKRYTTGIRLTTIALLISIVLMMVNKFIIIEETPTKVEVIGIEKAKSHE